jgi:plastocyanin
MRALVPFIAASALLFGATQAVQAADLTVSVRTPQGAPVKDAVVTIPAPAGSQSSGPIRFDWPYRMAQKDLQFDPFVLVVPVGAKVSFPNFDPVRHHVYSFSEAKTFELKLYGQDQTRSVIFDKPGLITVGCNIHDQMLAFILVVDTPYAAKTDAKGLAHIPDAPGGAVTLTIWQPYLKALGNTVSVKATLPRAGPFTQPVTVGVRAPLAKRGAY